MHYCVPILSSVRYSGAHRNLPIPWSPSAAVLHSRPIRLISPTHKHTFAFSSHTAEAVPVGGGGADMIRVVSGRTGSSLAVRCVCGCRCVWNRKSAGCRPSAMCVWEAGGGPARMADIPGECVWERESSQGRGSNWAWSQRSAGCPSARRKTQGLFFSLSSISICFFFSCLPFLPYRSVGGRITYFHALMPQIYMCTYRQNRQKFKHTIHSSVIYNMYCMYFSPNHKGYGAPLCFWVLYTQMDFCAVCVFSATCLRKLCCTAAHGWGLWFEQTYYNKD